MKNYHFLRSLFKTRKLKCCIIRSLIFSHQLNQFLIKTNLLISSLQTLRSMQISYRKTCSHTLYQITADNEKVSSLWILSNQLIKTDSKLSTRPLQMKTYKTFSRYHPSNQQSMWICSIPTLTPNPKYSLIISDYSLSTTNS